MARRPGLDLPKVLQAAAEIADQQGIQEVTLAGLAKKLNIRPPSLYNHVDGLPGLLSKLAVYGLEQLKIALVQSAIGRSGDDAVRAFGIAYVAFARSHPGLYEITLRAPNPEDEEVQAAASEILDVIFRILRAYSLDEQALIHAVRGLRSMLHGFASLEQKGGFGLPLDLDESLEWMMDAYLMGLRTLPER